MSKRTNAWLAATVTLFGRNWITLFGAVMSGVSAVTIVGFLLLQSFQPTESPYLGIMSFLILPGVFVTGLLIIPVGAFWERRRILRAGPGAAVADVQPFPTIDLNNSHTRRVAGLVLILTVFNLFIISMVTYQGVVFMDSVTFCGKLCHSVMEPEYTAYMRSPHSRVVCVDCHIGPGAPWFVRSKLSGLRQVFAVTFDTYERPIPTPVHNLRPSRETCEECHWPARFSGDRVKVITRFQEDEANTCVRTVLLMHVGGGAAGGNGIHSWHIDPSKRTVYVAADPQRQNILSVRVEKSDGTTTEYRGKDVEAAAATAGPAEERVMDCIDCHNRPTHIYSLPEDAMDTAMAGDRIDKTLPFIKKVGVEALKEAKDQEGAKDGIGNQVRTFYEGKYPDLYAAQRATIEKAIEEMQVIYSTNVFPKMKVGWGKYQSNIGHEAIPGCFRCHNDEHVDSSGKSIGQDCTICHSVLAWNEEDPEILKQLGI